VWAQEPTGIGGSNIFGDQEHRPLSRQMNSKPLDTISKTLNLPELTPKQEPSVSGGPKQGQ